MLNKIRFLKEKFLELEKEMLKPEVIADSKKYAELCKEYNELEPISIAYDEYAKVQNTLNSDMELVEIESDNEMRSMLNAEIEECKKTLKEMDENIKILLLPKDDNDDRNVIIEIRSGAGGEEASLFGGVLLRMYSMYAESKRWKVEILSVNETELGGIKEASFRICGKGAYSKFKYESGVHRVQRVPETESSGRIHTSTATVAVLPEHEEVDVEVNEKDLQIDVYRSGGAGGQHVNTTDSAVRITHIPTGIVVACQNERSQIQNREVAMKMLKSKLLALELDKKMQESLSLKGDAKKIEWGSQIRSYVFCPYTMVKDHRTNYETSDVYGVMDGNIKEFIFEFLKLIN